MSSPQPPLWSAWQAGLAKRLRDPLTPHNPSDRHAAVSIVLQLGPEPDVLFMVRAQREGDRWSGQVAFPGGHHEPSDTSLLDTARRETLEEVGLDLVHVAHPLGQLAPVQARSHGQRLSLWVTPFVFVQHTPAEWNLGPEAAHAFRIPLAPLLEGLLAAEKTLKVESLTKRYPAWRFQDHLVWGMTYHILGAFMDEVRPLGPLPESLA